MYAGYLGRSLSLSLPPSLSLLLSASLFVKVAALRFFEYTSPCSLGSARRIYTSPNAQTFYTTLHLRPGVYEHAHRMHHYLPAPWPGDERVVLEARLFRVILHVFLYQLLTKCIQKVCTHTGGS